jgi:DNA-binding MarR family transcriptional regulator
MTADGAVQVDDPILPLLGAVRTLSHHAVELTDHLRTASHVNDTDFRALTAIQGRPGLTAGELAAMLHRSPGAVSTVLERLEDAGHVERRRDQDDRRRVTLWTTPLPHQVAAEALDPFVARIREEFADDDPGDLAVAADVLARAAAVMDSFLAEHRDGSQDH